MEHLQCLIECIEVCLSNTTNEKILLNILIIISSKPSKKKLILITFHLKPDIHETNFSREANFSPRIFCLRIRSLISTGTISFANSPRIMQKNMASVRRLLLFKIMQKRQRKGYLVRKIYSERLQKGEFHLLVRDLRLHDQE